MFISTITTCLLNTSIITVNQQPFPAASLNSTAWFHRRMEKSSWISTNHAVLGISVIFWYGFSKNIIDFVFLGSSVHIIHKAWLISRLQSTLQTDNTRRVLAPSLLPLQVLSSLMMEEVSRVLCWLKWIFYLNPKFSNLTGPLFRGGENISKTRQRTLKQAPGGCCIYFVFSIKTYQFVLELKTENPWI